MAARAHLHAELISLSAGTAARREGAVQRVRQLLPGVCWEELAATLRERRLLPTLGPRIVALAGERADPDFVAATDQVMAAVRNHGRHLQLTSLRIAEMLAKAGVSSAPLKGPALAESLYGDVGRRACGDIDLLVAAEQLDRAVDVATELGYLPPSDPVDGDGLPRLHFTMTHPNAALPPVELHWRIHWYERRFAAERLMRPEPIDHLAALLLFYARDGFVDLRLACDVGAWWDQCGERVPRGELSRLMGAYPALAPAIGAAAYVAERTVGLPLATLTGGDYEPSLRARLAARLANPHPRGSASQIYAEMGLIDGLLTPRGGLPASLRRQLLPSAQVLDHRAGRTGTHRTSSKMLYGARLAIRWGVLARYVRALARAGLPRRSSLGTPSA